MYRIKDIISGLFGLRDNYNDTGFLKEFNELLADDFDSNEFTSLQDSFQNLLNWSTIRKKFLDIRIQELKMPYLSTDDSMIRICYRFFDKFQKIKGTKKGFEIMFRLIGIDSDISITWSKYEGRFDSEIYKHDGIRKLDSYAGNYTGINIALKCTKKLTVEIINMIYNVINYNLPMDSYILTLTYNGAEMGDSEVYAGRSFSDSFNESFGNYIGEDETNVSDVFPLMLPISLNT